MSKNKVKAESQSGIKNARGITLVALVVTIVVLLILAGITIAALFSDNGIIAAAQRASDQTKEAVNTTEKELENLAADLSKVLNNGSGKEEKITTANVAEKLYGEDNLAKETKTIYDANDNAITIPKGFKIVPNGTNGVVYKDASNPHVTDGIVVADKDGNEFVWIGVGNIKRTDGTSEEIKLARREFSALNKSTWKIDGDGHVVQTIEDGSALREANTDYDFKELSKDSEEATTYGNTKSESISTFITSARDTYHGYYIARYEASYKDANTPYSKPSTSTRTSSSTALTSGMLWNFITQPNAATISKNMYNNDTYKNYVTSDLINSYAWDTALYFIQQFSGQSDYSKQNSKNTGSLGNTGERTSTTTDIVCNIYDMASNTREWSTETYTLSGSPCVIRGGIYSTADIPASIRNGNNTSISFAFISFRPALYVNL